MELISGVIKKAYLNYTLYFINNLSDEFKDNIRKYLSEICHGEAKANRGRLVYSYKETLRKFISIYKNESKSKNKTRQKGLIGELLVHIILKLENKFVKASAFFNLEENSFKKGYDLVLFESGSNELWITEVKSGEKQKNQANSSASMVALINEAQNDLEERLSSNNSDLWINAINAANSAMSNSNSQKDIVITLLEDCADCSCCEPKIDSSNFNVILTGVLFHPLSESVSEKNVGIKYKKIVKQNIFKNVLVIAIQKETFQAVFDFLESEIENEI